MFFLNRPSTPLVSSADDLLLAAEHDRQIEFDAGGANAMLGQRMLGFVQPVRRFQQGLAGDAADAKASAAETRFPFDAGDVHAELRGANRGRISAGPAADDDQIVLVHWILIANG